MREAALRAGEKHDLCEHDKSCRRTGWPAVKPCFFGLECHAQLPADLLNKPVQVLKTGSCVLLLLLRREFDAAVHAGLIRQLDSDALSIILEPEAAVIHALENKAPPLLPGAAASLGANYVFVRLVCRLASARWCVHELHSPGLLLQTPCLTS